jgi:hypothetical protein
VRIGTGLREVQYGLQHTEIVPRHGIDIGIFGQLARRHAFAQKACQNLTLMRCASQGGGLCLRG